MIVFGYNTVKKCVLLIEIASAMPVGQCLMTKLGDAMRSSLKDAPGLYFTGSKSYISCVNPLYM